MPDDLTTNHVRRAIAGENASLEWLVERLAPLLVAQARYRLGTFAGQLDPEDVVHDAWVVTLPRLPDLIARGGRLTPVLLQFLSTAVTNRVRNLLRSRARHPDAGPIVDPTAVRSGVVTQALRNERAAAIHGAIAELDDKDREVVAFAMGTGLPTGTRISEPVTPGIGVVLFARLLGISPPASAQDRLPAALLQDKQDR